MRIGGQEVDSQDPVLEGRQEAPVVSRGSEPPAQRATVPTDRTFKRKFREKIVPHFKTAA